MICQQIADEGTCFRMRLKQNRYPVILFQDETEAEPVPCDHAVSGRHEVVPTLHGPENVDSAFGLQLLSERRAVGECCEVKAEDVTQARIHAC